MDVKRVIKPPPWLVSIQTRTILSALQDAPATVRFVGGCVRDHLLGKTVTDLDLATTLEPSNVLQQLENATLKAVPLGIAYGSVLVVMEPYHYEITTLRRDVKTDGRHAKICFTDDWEEDAQRRDFTFNALYLSIRGDLYDPWGGEEDLQRGYVRFIGNPRARIQEDYLRILRYFRFHACYGRGEMDPEALQACRDEAEKIKTLSAERIRTEFLKLLKTPDPSMALQRMVDTGVWFYATQGAPAPCINDLKNLIKVEQEFQVAPEFLRRLVVILPNDSDALKTLAQRLKLTGKQRQEAQILTKAATGTCTDKDEMLYDYGLGMARDALLIQAARGYDRFLLEQLPAHWEKPVFPLSGEDLKTLGIAPGPFLGETLKHVETWWVRHHFKPNVQSCLEEVQKYVHRSGSRS